MEKLSNIPNFKIYIDTVINEHGQYTFIDKDGLETGFPDSDFYVPVFLQRKNELYDYVQVDREDKIQPINRQEFNPFFIEFGFFDTIERGKVNRGGELTFSMIKFIKLRRPDVSSLSDSQIRKWFDETGINEFPWNKGTSNETNIDDIDRVGFVASNIVSKAKHLNIDINS